MPRLFLVVLCSLLFLPAIPAEAQSAFTIEYTTKTYYKTGKVRGVRHSMLALRADGSWVELQRTARSGGHEYVTKRVWNPAQQVMSYVDPRERTITEIRGAVDVRFGAGPSECAKAKPSSERMLGYKVSYYEMKPLRVVSWAEYPVLHGLWVAQELGCAVLRSESEMRGVRGGRDTLEVREATRITIGEPEGWLFETPPDFKIKVLNVPRVQN